jgi:hypothetical protein
MIGLTGYFDDDYSLQLRALFKERKWKPSEAVKAGIELLLSLPESLAAEIVKRQVGVKCHTDLDDLVTITRKPPGKVKPRYDVKKAQDERGPQLK